VQLVDTSLTTFGVFLTGTLGNLFHEEYNLITTGEKLLLKVGLEFKEGINRCSPSVRYNEMHFQAYSYVCLFSAINMCNVK
jgi:hypothetical protein